MRLPGAARRVTKVPLLLLVLPWLSLPVVASVYLLLWDRMPERLVVHFDPMGRPAGSMTRVQSFVFDLAVLLVMLAGSHFKMRRQEPPERGVNTLLLCMAVGLFMLAVFWMLWHNIVNPYF